MPRFFARRGARRTSSARTARSALARRFGIEALEDRLALSGGGIGLPQFNFIQATTKDAASIAVDYSIASAAIQQSLTLDVYRSDKPVVDASSSLVGETTIASALLTQGTHTGVTLLQGTVLTPNTALPYLVVVADGNGAVAEDPSSVNTTYFRTFELGVVVHGKESTTNNATPAWETSMANDVKTIDHYDATIAFNWVKDSSTAAAGLATKAGDALYSQIAASAAALDGSHAGDVVDLQLIGHSRGAVVVSRALQDLASQPVAALRGSYVQVTLLDPHPANTADANLYSAQSGLFGAIAVIGYLGFESATKDPEVVLPAGAGIRSIQVDYQHTPASGFAWTNVESLLNLWGEGPGSGLQNQSGVPIQWHNLTSVKDPTVGLIGHSEIHAWYQLRVVDAGSALAGAATVVKPSAVTTNTAAAPAVNSTSPLSSSAQTSPAPGPLATLLSRLWSPRRTPT